MKSWMSLAVHERGFFYKGVRRPEDSEQGVSGGILPKILVLVLFSFLLLVTQACSVKIDKSSAEVNGKEAGEYYKQFQSSKSDPRGLASVSDGSTLYIYDDGRYELSGAVPYSGSWSVSGVNIVLNGYGSGQGLTSSINGHSSECISTTASAGGLSGKSLTFCK